MIGVDDVIDIDELAADFWRLGEFFSSDLWQYFQHLVNLESVRRECLNGNHAASWREVSLMILLILMS